MYNITDIKLDSLNQKHFFYLLIFQNNNNYIFILNQSRSTKLKQRFQEQKSNC